MSALKDDLGQWSHRLEDGRSVLQSDNFEHDACLALSGDFATKDDQIEFAAKVARKLSGAPLDGSEAPRSAIEPIPVVWQPIETAPRDNKRMLLLARFDENGDLSGEIDLDGIWDSETDGWENGNNRTYFWASAFGRVEEPTHWAYQPEWLTKLAPVSAPPEAEPKNG